MYDQNDPAFPIAMPGSIEFAGLTKREYIAAIALQGLLANPHFNEQLKNIADEGRSGYLADQAVMRADALIEALKA